MVRGTDPLFRFPAVAWAVASFILFPIRVLVDCNGVGSSSPGVCRSFAALHSSEVL
jgi:hypothetical protein